MQIREQSYGVEPIDNSKPHPANPRRGDLESIEASIAVNGFYGAIYVQDSSSLIIVGNHRWRAAKARGATEIPVIRVVCSDIEAERIAAADNRTHDLGGYDVEAQVAQLSRLAEAGGLAGTGYNPETFAALENELAAMADGIASTPTPDGGDDDEGATSGVDKVDDMAGLHVPSEPITKRGDLWILGSHRLICGDCFSIDIRRQLFGDTAADMVLTDPPFAIYGSSTGIGADIADDRMVRPFFEQLCKTIAASVREFAHVYMCCDWRTWPSIWEGARSAKLSPKNCIVWDKMSTGLGSSYANTHEFVGFFAKLPPPTSMKSTTKRGQRVVLQPNLTRHPRVSGAEREHNAAKPVAMCEWLIKNSSDAGETVVDFFGGSGTTMIAAERTGRRCLMTEVEPKWCDVIVARWERVTGKRGQRVPAVAAPHPEEQNQKPPKKKSKGSEAPATDGE